MSAFEYRDFNEVKAENTHNDNTALFTPGR